MAVFYIGKSLADPFSPNKSMTHLRIFYNGGAAHGTVHSRMTDSRPRLKADATVAQLMAQFVAE